MKKILLTATAAITCAMMASAASYTVTAQPAPDEDWDDYGYVSLATEAVPVTVDPEGQSITIEKFLGSNTDLILCYDDDEAITSIIPVVDGVEGEEITPDPEYNDFAFSLDDCEYYFVSISASVDSTGAYADDSEGYVWLSGYFYKTQTDYVLGYYSLEWAVETALAYSVTAEASELDTWKEDYPVSCVPECEVEVNVYDDYSIELVGWNGLEDNALYIEFDEDDNVTYIAFYDGEEYSEADASGYLGAPIEFCDYYYANFYIAEDYAYATASLDKEVGGYVCLTGYFYEDEDNYDWTYYYIAWGNGDSEDGGSGVKTVSVTVDGKTTYYNLKGISVENPTTPGVYVKRQGNETSKVVIR